MTADPEAALARLDGIITYLDSLYPDGDPMLGDLIRVREAFGPIHSVTAEAADREAAHRTALGATSAAADPAALCCHHHMTGLFCNRHYGLAGAPSDEA